MKYSLHSDISFRSDFFGFGYFISGLIIWNVVTLAGVWFLVFLFNKTKQ